MRADDDTRDLEQELASGQDEATPFLALSSVVVAVAVLFTVALALVVIAYLVA
jgi:hypothetical protein